MNQALVPYVVLAIFLVVIIVLWANRDGKLDIPNPFEAWKTVKRNIAALTITQDAHERDLDELDRKLKEVVKQIVDLAKHLEELRLSKTNDEEKLDVQLDSNWHIRRRNLERQFAKTEESNAK